MQSVIKYDTVILTKEYRDKFCKVGDEFEVVSILNDSMYLLRDAKTKVAIGTVNLTDFDEYFVHKENFKGWTPWQKFIGGNGETDIAYRTNRKKVQVRGLTNNVMGESHCHKDDDFVLMRGIYIAYMRYLLKSLGKQKKEHEDKVKQINSEMVENSNLLGKMLASLQK